MPTSNPEVRRLEERVNQSRDSVFKKYGYWPSQLEEMRRQMTTASAIAQLIMSGSGDIQSGFWKMVDLGLPRQSRSKQSLRSFGSLACSRADAFLSLFPWWAGGANSPPCHFWLPVSDSGRSDAAWHAALLLIDQVLTTPAVIAAAIPLIWTTRRSIRRAVATGTTTRQVTVHIRNIASTTIKVAQPGSLPTPIDASAYGR